MSNWGVCLLLVPAIGAVLSASAQQTRTVWDGVYTGAQAERGQANYAVQCARCHRDDLGAYNSVLAGPKFMDRWSEDSLLSFGDLLMRTMPRNAPATLSKAQYSDIVSYVLQYNGFPAGARELNWDEMKTVRVQSKDGPQPVPDFALVAVVGCLSRSADGSWLVSRASEPVRTRDPKDSTSEERLALRSKPLGTHLFRLLDPSGVQPSPPDGQKVETKGFLIRQPAGDKLNPTSLQSLGEPCR